MKTVMLFLLFLGCWGCHSVTSSNESEVINYKTVSGFEDIKIIKELGFIGSGHAGYKYTNCSNNKYWCFESPVLNFSVPKSLEIDAKWFLNGFNYVVKKSGSDRVYTIAIKLDDSNDKLLLSSVKEVTYIYNKGLIAFVTLRYGPETKEEVLVTYELEGEEGFKFYGNSKSN